jgi:hypothetical protein
MIALRQFLLTLKDPRSRVRDCVVESDVADCEHQ